MIINARFLCQKITGVQRFAIELSKEIKKLDPSVVFVSPRNIVHKKLAEELEVITFGRFGGHVWEQLELPFFLKKKGGPVLVNLSNTAPLMYSKNISTVHDLAFYHHPEWFARKFSIAYKFMIPYLTRKSLHVFTVSNFSKEDIAESFRVKGEKVNVIYNGVSELFSSHCPSVGSYTSHEKPYLLCVGSLDPRKNLERLLKAFRLYENNDIELLVVGGKNKSFSNFDLKEFAREDPRVKLLGYVPDDCLQYLYSNAVAFIYPSLYEGFGIPPIEAQAMGCPVISSSSTSLPEVLGDSALYCDPYDVHDIHQKISSLVSDNDLQESLRKRGARNIVNYSWEKSAKKLLEILGEIS